MMLGVILFERNLEFDAKFTFLTIFFILVYRCLGMCMLAVSKLTLFILDSSI